MPWTLIQESAGTLNGIQMLMVISHGEAEQEWDRGSEGDEKEAGKQLAREPITMAGKDAAEEEEAITMYAS